MTIENAAATTPTVTVAATPAPDKTLLETAGDASKPTAPGSLLDQAGEAEKQEQLAEEKRLLDSKDDDLTAEELDKKAELIKAKEVEAKTKADAKTAADKAANVPEKYDFKMPEGMTLDTRLAEMVTPIFKEFKLSQEQAQKLATVQAQYIAEQEKAQAEAFTKFCDDSKVETIKALGANYQQELAFVAKVRDRFLSDETKEMLNKSGMSNNKALIMDLIKIGRLISESTIVEGKREIPGGAKGIAELMYPNQGK